MDAVHGADFDAARIVEMSLAFHARIGINDENLIAFRNGRGRAFGFTRAASDAGFVNVQGHDMYLKQLSFEPSMKAAKLERREDFECSGLRPILFSIYNVQKTPVKSKRFSSECRPEALDCLHIIGAFVSGRLGH